MKKPQIFPYKAFCLFVVAEMFLEVAFFLQASFFLKGTRLVDNHGWLTKETFGYSLFI